MNTDPSETTVLVADDDAQLLGLVARRLKGMGLRVVEAMDGDQAWAKAEEVSPALVVLDVMMPGMSGWEVCRRIRESGDLDGTKVLMLTGIGVRLNEMTSPLYGADDYLDKPFEFDAFDRKVKDLLDSSAES